DLSLSSANGSRARRRPRGRRRRGSAEGRAAGLEDARVTSPDAPARSAGEQDRRDERDERREFGRLRLELAPPLWRDAIELRLAPELGRAPFGFDPVVALHAVERGIERAFFDAQAVAAPVLQPADDAVAVPRAERERFENEGVERAVESVHAWIPGVRGAAPRSSSLAV